MRRIKTVTCTILCLFLFTLLTCASSTAHALDLAPKDEGPSLAETIKWLKIKFSSVPGIAFEYDGKKFIFTVSIFK